MSERFSQSLIDGGRPYWVWGPLVFSSFYFLPLIFNNQYFTVITGSISIIIFLGFLFLYYQAANSKGENALPVITAMLALCITGTYITPGTQSLFGFISFFCGFNLTFKKGLAGVISILVSILLSAFLFNFFEVNFIAPAVIVSIALFFMGRAERKDRIHDQREKISQQSIEQLATIAERERIARDMHDLIGHSLTSIALKAELAEKYINVEKNALAQKEITEVSALSRDILSQVRQAVSGLKTKDISAQLNQLETKLKNHNFAIKVTNNLTQIPAIIESTLILILTEAVTNILKHSNGDNVNIVLNQQHENINLLVSDNGQVSEVSSGNGLTGIAERCQQLNGTVEINHDQGLSLNINLPKSCDD